MICLRHILRNGIAMLLCGPGFGAWSASYTAPSSNPENLVAFKDFIYCSADDGLHGRELWRVNLEGKKELVKNITPGSEGTEIKNFVPLGDLLYFQVNDPVFGREFWRTDGTEKGTWCIKRFEYGPGMGFDMVLGEFRGKIIIRVLDADPKLWISDGTEQGTFPFVKEGESKLFHSAISNVYITQNYLYFGGLHLDGNTRVFRSDGTVQGTIVLCRSEQQVSHFISLDGESVLFFLDTPEYGVEPWVSDGTPENTRLLIDINPGSAEGGGGTFHRVDNGMDKPMAMFGGTNPATGNELWITDGTTEGTRPYQEAIPGPNAVLTGKLASVQQFLYFIGRDPEFGSEVWLASPYRNELTRMSDANPGVADADPYAFCLLRGSRLVFSAANSDVGEEVWGTGFASPAKLLFDINPGPASSLPYFTTELNGQAVFAATEPVNGRELWVTNGENDAKLLADIYSDASINPSSSPRNLTAMGDVLYFVANDITHGNEPWRSDGTPGGTHLLKDVLPGRASSNTRELTPSAGWLYFSAEDGVDGVRLWRSDGTEVGTSVFDRQSTGPEHLTAFSGGVYFSARDDSRGRELWRALPDGSGVVKDIASRAQSSNPHSLLVVGKYLYFIANDGVHGEELWRTDGSEVGTVMVRDIVNVPYEPVSAAEMTEAGERLFFAGDTVSQGSELWSFDFGALSVSPVLDIAQVDTLLLTRPAGEYER